MAKPIRVYSDVEKNQYIEFHPLGDAVSVSLGDESREESMMNVDFSLDDLAEIAAVLHRIATAPRSAPKD